MSESTDYDVIVVGCGGIGSAAVYWLAKRIGNKVLGLEQFQLGHDNGGSQDHSRIIRFAYHDAKYTKLAPHAYKAFSEVEEESGLKLVHKTGSLDIAVKGTKGEQILELYAKAMDSENIKYEMWTNDQLTQRFPQFLPNKDLLTLYQADGGLVDAALANSTHIQLALARGARVIDQCPVTRIEARTEGGVKVFTPKGRYTCRRLVITAGSWTNHVLRSVGVQIPLKVLLEQVTYYATPHVKQFTKERFPVFLFHADVDYYGMPCHVNSGSKLGLDAAGPEVTPETRTYAPDPIREEKAKQFLEKYIPNFLGPKMYTKTCLYDITPDRDFVIDSLAFCGKPQIVVCNGAAHAFKFSSILGKILAELSTSGRTMYDISEFKFNRSAIVDPDTDKNNHYSWYAKL